MLNNILLISERMVEHNAVIYVYCDFNLKLLHRLAKFISCSTMFCFDSKGMHVFIELFYRLYFDDKIDESIRYHEEN